MFYKKFIYCCFIFYSAFIYAHSFYKTMPKEVEHIYDELKRIEEYTLNDFKKAYPKVPADLWNKVDFIEQQTQIWLSDTAPAETDTKEPLSENYKTTEEMKEYCTQFITHECEKLDIDFRKIDVRYLSLSKGTLANVAGPFIKRYDYDIESRSFFEYMANIGSFYYGIDSTKNPLITIDIEKFIRQEKYYKKKSLKHEIVHITEAHNAKQQLIQNLIICHYGLKEIETETFLKINNNYCKVKELIADIVPALISPEFISEYLNNTDHSYAGTDIHPNGITIRKWLLKIKWFLFVHRIKNKFTIIINYIVN